MSTTNQNISTIGWIGMGRMGYAMAERLLQAGNDVSVWNRTQSKAEPLVAQGAKLAQNPSDLASCDVVFTMLSTSNDVKQVLFGDTGLLSGDSKPKMIVECSTISGEASAEICAELGKLGIDYLASPVSGNAKCVTAGKLAIVTSGAEHLFKEVQPYLEAIGGLGVTYVGEGELSRTVKICHNVFLGIVTQSLAELTILAQQSGVSRNAFLDFMNKSVMGSIFTKYKTPGWVNQDYTVTFTPELMRKDMDLGLQMGRNLEVPMPTASVVRDQMQQSMGTGNRTTMDFSIVLDHMAKCSGIEKLESENVEVSDGLDVAS
jgi:3-hydroxyisobutyrate dehydrogenase